MRTSTAHKLQTDPQRKRSQKRGHGEKLSRNAELAILALLANPTIPKAAKAAGISETTLWRWLQEDDFRAKYKEAQNKVFDGALSSLQGAATDAVDCLRRNLNCKTPAVQVQAARAILDFSLKAEQMFDLQTRISCLEVALDAREQAEKVSFEE